MMTSHSDPRSVEENDVPTIEQMIERFNQPPTVAQWLARYKARMLARGVPEDAAQAAVEAVDMASGEDSTYSLDDDPEAMADDEMSYWDDDGE
jgi:hypothetical protein